MLDFHWECVDSKSRNRRDIADNYVRNFVIYKYFWSIRKIKKK